GDAVQARSERLDERAVNAVVEAQTLVQLGGRRGRGGEIHLHVGAGDELRIRDAGEVAPAQVFNSSDFAGYGSQFLLHALDQLVDRLLLAPIVEDEGGAVFTGVRVHVGLCG